MSHSFKITIYICLVYIGLIFIFSPVEARDDVPNPAAAKARAVLEFLPIELVNVKALSETVEFSQYQLTPNGVATLDTIQKALGKELDGKFTQTHHGSIDTRYWVMEDGKTQLALMQSSAAIDFTIDSRPSKANTLLLSTLKVYATSGGKPVNVTYLQLRNNMTSRSR